jgi:hypothetical protein
MSSAISIAVDSIGRKRSEEAAKTARKATGHPTLLPIRTARIAADDPFWLPKNHNCLT